LTEPDIDAAFDDFDGAGGTGCSTREQVELLRPAGGSRRVRGGTPAVIEIAFHPTAIHTLAAESTARAMPHDQGEMHAGP
jgi:hypothetical protein